MNSPKNVNHPNISGDPLDCNDYIRSRLSPQSSDELYLHLADLREGLKQVETSSNLKILDYGCGGSPYRSLFPNATYHRADYISLEGLDFQISEDASLPAVQDCTYDMLLSTQVLEHVRKPEKYLSEAIRVLKPGGALVLSTHGVFYDHACPYDFRRWTADGLDLILREEGFSSIKIFKLTTNTRAIFFLAENSFGGLFDSRKKQVGMALWLFNKWFWSRRKLRNTWADKNFENNRVVPSDQPGHPLYIALLAVAQK
jgi:SAM-dependent methyltransferase